MTLTPLSGLGTLKWDSAPAHALGQRTEAQTLCRGIVAETELGMGQNQQNQR